MNDWTRIEEGNNWQSIYYSYAGERLNAHGTCDEPRSLVLKKEAIVSVRFPDGEEATLPLVERRSSASYCDHSLYSTEVTQVRFGVEIEVHGVKTFVDLTKVEVRYGSIPRRCDK